MQPAGVTVRPAPVRGTNLGHFLRPAAAPLAGQRHESSVGLLLTPNGIYLQIRLRLINYIQVTTDHAKTLSHRHLTTGPRFVFKSVHVVFFVTKAARGHVCCRRTIFSSCFTPSRPHMIFSILLPLEGQAGEKEEPSNKAIFLPKSRTLKSLFFPSDF